MQAVPNLINNTFIRGKNVKTPNPTIAGYATVTYKLLLVYFKKDRKFTKVFKNREHLQFIAVRNF